MKEKLKKIVGAGDSARPQKRNTQKGITLVALVITIIVLLILAMVSISIVMNQGIMTKSKEAADKYNEAANNEQEELTFFEKLFGKYSDGNTIVDNAAGDNTIVESPYVTPRTEVEYKGQTLKVGDYVNYDEGTGYEWTTDASKGTGGSTEWNSTTQSSDLTSKTYTTEDMSWRVLGLDANGNLELISDKQTSEYLYLKGKAGYNNGEEQLNEMCNTLYGQGEIVESARSVNAEDINAILGYDKRKYSDYGRKYTYTSNFKTPEGTEATDEEPITIERNHYYYNKSELKDKVDSNILNMVFRENYNNNFWLASRYVDASCEYAGWGLFGISGDYLDGVGLDYSHGYEDNYSRYVRPVVSLKSDVQLSGNSTEGWTIQ